MSGSAGVKAAVVFDTPRQGWEDEDFKKELTTKLEEQETSAPVDDIFAASTKDLSLEAKHEALDEEENLVDEVYITITPRILGGREAPTPADGAGFLKDKQLRLELVSSRRHGDEVFLKYRVK